MKQHVKPRQQRFSLLLAICLLLAVFPVSPLTSYGQEAAAGTDVTNTGLDLSAGFPNVQTVYQAGEGTITYTPAAEGSPHKLTLNNASVTAPEAGGSGQNGGSNRDCDRKSEAKAHRLEHIS